MKLIFIVAALSAILSLKIAEAGILYRFGFGWNTPDLTEAQQIGATNELSPAREQLDLNVDGQEIVLNFDNEEENTNFEKTFDFGGNHIIFKFSHNLREEEEELETSTIASTSTSTESTFIPSITMGPTMESELFNLNDVNASQRQLNQIAYAKVLRVREVLVNLEQELAHYKQASQRISGIADRLNSLLVASADINSAEHEGKFKILGDFVELMKQLQQYEQQDGANALENAILHTALFKSQALQLQEDIEENTFKAQQQWSDYVQKKLIEVTV